MVKYLSTTATAGNLHQALLPCVKGGDYLRKAKASM